MTSPDPQQMAEFVANAAGYTPPMASGSNQDQAAFAAAIEAAVAAKMAQMGLQATAKPRELTPEEAARAAIDNAGKGLGVDERLAELYKHLDTIAKKVGL